MTQGSAPTAITIADIKVGDAVKVAGTLGTGMAINAKVIKDSSLPITPAAEKEKDDNGKHNGWLNFNWGALLKMWKKD